MLLAQCLWAFINTSDNNSRLSPTPFSLPPFLKNYKGKAKTLFSVMLFVYLTLTALAKPADPGAISAKITLCGAGKAKNGVK